MAGRRFLSASSFCLGSVLESGTGAVPAVGTTSRRAMQTSVARMRTPPYQGQVREGRYHLEYPAAAVSPITQRTERQREETALRRSHRGHRDHREDNGLFTVWFFLL